MGRPTKLTAAIQENICNALKTGNTRADAAVYAGIDPATFYNWMKKGKQAKSGEFFEFFGAVRKAEADCAVRNVTVIQKAATGGQLIGKKTITRKNGDTEVDERYSQGDWQAAAWWLERRRHKKFGRKEKHEHTGKDGKPIEISFIEVIGAEPANPNGSNQSDNTPAG